MEQESVTLPPGAGFTITFSQGPSNNAVSRDIGLSIQDTNRVASDGGWWFRSGRFSDALPIEEIEVLLGNPVEITASDLPSLLPSTLKRILPHWQRRLRQAG